MHLSPHPYMLMPRPPHSSRLPFNHAKSTFCAGIFVKIGDSEGGMSYMQGRLILYSGIYDISIGQISVGSFHVRIETHPVFETLCCFGILDDEQIPKTE
jgi:hypothetical protein